MLERRKTPVEEIPKELQGLLIYSKDRYIVGNAYELVRVISGSGEPFKQEFIQGILLKYSERELIFLTIRENIIVTPNFDDDHRWYPHRALDGSDESFTMYGLNVNTDILKKYLHKDKIYYLSYDDGYYINYPPHGPFVYTGYTIDDNWNWPKLNFERGSAQMSIFLADVLRNKITISNMNIGDEIRFI